MRKIIAFTIVSVDGCYAGPNGEIDWFKSGSDDEDRQFSSEASGSSGTLIFGHTTYEMMAGFWPTPDAVRNDPVMAGVMNSTPKIVFSKTLKPVEDGPVWKNVRIFRDIVPEEIKKLKEQGEGTIAILGSGSIVQQFSRFGLIDEYQLMVVPVILGTGKYLFRDFYRMNLKLLEIRTFRNGKVFLKYKPT
jgi:dihydrofolate reductase